MKVKNIKSFIDFYQSLGISTSVTDEQRNRESSPVVQNKAYSKDEKISEKMTSS